MNLCEGALKMNRGEWSEDFYYNRNMWKKILKKKNVTVCIALAMKNTITTLLGFGTAELHHSHTLHDTMETTSLSKDYKNPSSSTCEAHFWVVFVKSEC